MRMMISDVLFAALFMFLFIAMNSTLEEPADEDSSPAPDLEARRDLPIRGHWIGGDLVLEVAFDDSTGYVPCTDLSKLELSPSRGVILGVAELAPLVLAAAAAGAPVTLSAGGM